jgi:flavin reductase (DIM6/NTAB) family NADH-FMN oxidoreductase RutF
MDPKTQQKALRLLTNGLDVLTSRSGERYGAATITWVSQTSFKPPLVTVALRKDGSVLECLVESRTAILHVLDKDQQHLAQKFFAAPEQSNGKLNGESYRVGKNGAPVLESINAYLECHAVEILQQLGDHALAILEVRDAVVNGDVKPLTVPDSPWQYGG